MKEWDEVLSECLNGTREVTDAAVDRAEVALAEAYRMLKPGGILLINDMVRSSGTPEASAWRMRAIWP